MKNCMSIQSFLYRLKVYHMVSFIERYKLVVKYNNPQRRYDVMSRALSTYWKHNPLEECSICLEPGNFDIAVATPCGHIFCDACLIPHVRRKETCPNCREACSYSSILSQISVHRLIQLRPICTKPIEEIDDNIEFIAQGETTDNSSIDTSSVYSFQSQMNMSHLLIASILTIIASVVNILFIGMFIMSIFSTIMNFFKTIETNLYR